MRYFASILRTTQGEKKNDLIHFERKKKETMNRRVQPSHLACHYLFCFYHDAIDISKRKKKSYKTIRC